MTRISIACALTLVLACSGKRDEPAPPDPPARPAPVRPPVDAAVIDASPVRDHMADHFGAVGRIEQALMVGDLARVKAEAGYLAQHPEPTGMDGWKPHVDAMRVAARQVETAPDLIAAAGLTGPLDLECAHCHLARAAIVAFSWEPLPADDGTVPIRMQRHRWATSRLREGLIGPADALWLQGAEVLSAPELEALMAVRFEARDDARDLLDRIRTLARQAPSAETVEARAGLYGDMLATCTSCHERIRDNKPAGP